VTADRRCWANWPKGPWRGCERSSHRKRFFPSANNPRYQV